MSLLDTTGSELSRSRSSATCRSAKSSKYVSTAFVTTKERERSVSLATSPSLFAIASGNRTEIAVLMINLQCSVIQCMQCMLCSQLQSLGQRLRDAQSKAAPRARLYFVAVDAVVVPWLRSGISQSAPWFRDGSSEFFRRFDPLVDHAFCVRQGLLVRFPICHTAVWSRRLAMGDLMGVRISTMRVRAQGDQQSTL